MLRLGPPKRVTSSQPEADESQPDGLAPEGVTRNRQGNRVRNPRPGSVIGTESDTESEADAYVNTRPDRPVAPDDTLDDELNDVEGSA